MPELQDVVDDLAAQVGRPISVDDRRFRLLAHSAHEDESDADPVRRRSILSRHTSEEVVAWLTACGLLTARAPLDLPGNAPLGMAPRTVAPLRHGDVLLGFLWVITGATPLDDDERARFAAAATRVEAVLWARRAADDARSAAATALLAGDATAAAALGWPGAGRFVVAVARGGEEDVPARAARRLPDAVATGAAVIARDCAPADAVRALLAAGAGRAAAGREVALPAGVAASAREAALALLVADARADPPPSGGVLTSPSGADSSLDAVAFGELGAWADVADLWDRAGRPPAPAVLEPLDDQLRAALEAVLDAGGDVARAAAALPVHRATLYRRLERVEQLTGHDLARGDDRLRLHLALRLRRLSRAAARERDEDV